MCDCHEPSHSGKEISSSDGRQGTGDGGGDGQLGVKARVQGVTGMTGDGDGGGGGEGFGVGGIK